MVKKLDLSKLGKTAYWVKNYELSFGSEDQVKTEISYIDISYIVKELFTGTKENSNEFLKYCFHRLLSHSGANSQKNWFTVTDYGYYGEELRGFRLNGETCNDLVKRSAKLIKLRSNLSRILFVLEYEYGFLLEDFKKVKKCEIVQAGFDEIIMPKSNYNRRLNREIIDRYLEYSLPVCVCMPVETKYRLIDGYHRLAAQKEKQQEKFKIIVLE